MSKPFNLKVKKQKTTAQSKVPIICAVHKELKACFNGWKGQAKRRRKKFHLTFQDIQQIWIAQNGHCAVTGQAMTFTKKDVNKVSLDRVDSSGDYSYNNVRMVAVKVNYARHTYSDDDLRTILKDMEHIDRLRKALSGGKNWFKRAVLLPEYIKIFGRPNSANRR